LAEENSLAADLEEFFRRKTENRVNNNTSTSEIGPSSANRLRFPSLFTDISAVGKIWGSGGLLNLARGEKLKRKLRRARSSLLFSFLECLLFAVPPSP
jgi:hypothetical protein